MTDPVAVQIFHVRRPHFGAHSGIQQFVSHLDLQRVAPRMGAVSDGDQDFPWRAPWRWNWVRRGLTRLVQSRGQQWYKLSDLKAEWDALAPWWRHAIDVVHYVDGEHTAQFLPKLAATFTSRGRTMATFHQPPRILASLVPGQVVKTLDHVTVVASSQLEYFRSMLPDDRVSVILHGIDVDFFCPPVDARSGPVIRCLTSGSYLRDWGVLAAVVHALRDRTDIAFDVVSPSAPDFANASSVTRHRAVDDGTLRALYQRADLLVLPLVDATANNALLEGMASGVPAIATDLAALREYAPETCAVFVPHTAHSFVDAIVQLADDPATRARMGAAARARAQTFAWPVSARQYEALYLRLAGARTG